MSEELKPCPFCGGRASIRAKTTFTPMFVQCAETCGASAYGIREWNTRAPSPAAARVAELEREVAALREAAGKVVAGVDAWNESVRKITGRYADYEWGDLEGLRAALAPRSEA